MTVLTDKPKRAWKERLAALRHVPAVLRIVWQSGRWVVSWGLILRVLVAIGPLGGAYVAKLIINGVQQAISTFTLPRHFWLSVTAEILIIVATGLVSRLIDYFDSLLADRYTHFVSVRIMHQAAQLDLTTYENPIYYDNLDRARAQATDRLVMIQSVGRLFQYSLQTLFFSSVLFWKAPVLLLILAIAVIPSVLGESHFALLGYAKNYRQTAPRREMDYLRQMGGSKEAAKELKLFNLSAFFTARFTKLSEALYVENVAYSRARLFWNGIFSLSGNFGYYSSYLYLIWRAIHGAYDIGTFAFITAAVQQAQAYLHLVFSTASGVADQALFLTDLVGFFDIQPVVTSKPNGLKPPKPILQGFEFRDVSFSYPGTDRVVLDHFSLTLRPGQRIALIGANGEGKTTIVKLITRLYDPTDGVILLDGVDLREYDLDALHEEMGVIFQDFVRYDMTVRENIAVGHIETLHTDSDIQSAAEKSLASSIISRFPGGYEQMLGRRFENGTDISGGEWQRIALARAYLRSAQLLILDEPTAALDAKAELEVFQRFADLTSDKMALLISHRFSTVRMADHIVVLSEGRLVEEGTHSSLIQLGGRYAEMFEMQAASYR